MADRAEEVIVSALPDVTITVIEAEAARLGLLLSLTVAVKVEVPFAAGIPEIVPDDGSRLSPAGSLPEVTDHL